MNVQNFLANSSARWNSRYFLVTSLLVFTAFKIDVFKFVIFLSCLVPALFPATRMQLFGGARSKGFATLRNVSKLPFFDKIGHAKSVGFRFYSAI